MLRARDYAAGRAEKKRGREREREREKAEQFRASNASLAADLLRIKKLEKRVLPRVKSV